MTDRVHAAVAAATLALLLTAALAGCATPAGVGGGRADDDAPTETPVDAAWLDEGRIVGVVTQGSSACVPTAGDVALDGAVLEVELVDPDAATACTADLVPRVTLAPVPAGVDPAVDLEISVTGDYEGQATLAGVEDLDPSGETDFAPSAGWTATDGQFVLLTWGSSTCAPMLAAVEATGPAEVTATFQAPPENRACTMDMAPRGLVAWVEGVAADTPIELVLTGSPEFDGIRIPIYGTN